MNLQRRSWVPASCEARVQDVAERISSCTAADIDRQIEQLVGRNLDIHDHDCFNLNPASNVMNPKAEALLSRGLSSRASLGYPGDKYEMGLEAVEEIEIIAAELCAEIFKARFAEIRVSSGAMANLYGFMATCKPGDGIIVPPASIGGHVTHHDGGCAGLYGLKIHHAPVNSDGYTLDVDELRKLSQEVKPKLITVGGSLNLFPHPVCDVRAIADEVGAKVLFDAAHQCGIIAGGKWPNPLSEGAHMMTMSTYKSLGGPTSGLFLTNEADIAERVDAIAFPGMTANFDAANSAALAITMLDWREHGSAYASTMVEVAQAFAAELDKQSVPIFAKQRGFTQTHQFAIEAATYGGGQTTAKHLRKAGFLTCGIGLPIAEIAGDLNGLRIGTPEIVRRGVGIGDVGEMANLLADALKSDTPKTLAGDVAELRGRYQGYHFITTNSGD